MKKSLLVACARRVLLAAMVLTIAVPAFAGLQNVQVDAEIRIRGRYWVNVWETGGRWAQRMPSSLLPGRAIGEERAPGRTGMWTRFDWDDNGNDRKYVEQATHLGVTADFTDDVTARIEFEAFDVWGEDFRSNYITGADGITPTDDDLEVVQSYIQADEMFGMPLRLRIGRQALEFGKGWLVDKTFSGARRTPFDAIRVTYSANNFTLDAWWSKLAENSPAEEDGDVDLYGIYGTYEGVEALNISAYWMWVRDGRSLSNTDGIWLAEWIEDALNLDDYDVTNLHTVGIRLFGESGALDYDLELAYQFGNADSTGFLFAPFTYGDDGANYGTWGGDLDLGYTFDTTWSPRICAGGFYFGGEDNRDLSFWEWINPFNRPEASVSFSRLFGGNGVANVFDSEQLFTNIWGARLGLQAQPTEKVSVQAQLAYFAVVDTFDHPVSFTLGRYRIPIAPQLSFWTEEADDKLGWVTTLKAKYKCNENLYFALGWDHFFVGDGMTDGNYIYRGGLINSMGTDNDDADYVYFDTKLVF